MLDITLDVRCLVFFARAKKSVFSRDFGVLSTDRPINFQDFTLHRRIVAEISLRIFLKFVLWVIAIGNNQSNAYYNNIFFGGCQYLVKIKKCRKMQKKA